MTNLIQSSFKEQLIAKWVDILRLSPWRVFISQKRPSTGSLMECVITRPRQIAHIRMSDSIGDEELEPLIIHECLHTLFDPIREEVDFQLQSAPIGRRIEYKTRHDREIEKVVEHLSVVFYNQQLKPHGCDG